MEEEIIIKESYEESEDDFETSEFDEQSSRELTELKIYASEFTSTTEINELLSYPKIAKNLTYSLPHQTSGALRILREFNCNALLADEVGLGKTITTGIIIRECVERNLAKKILILTPPSLVDQWVEELRSKFELNFNIIEDENDWESFDYVIASIDRVKMFDSNTREFRHVKAHNITWDLLIVDEAHKLKDRSSMRTRFVNKIPKKRFMILTATPFQNDLIELYNLLNLLKRGHLGTIQSFRKQFLDRGNKRKPLNHLELKRKLNEVMVRRRRDETTVQYTQRIPRTISVKLTNEEMEIYNDIQDLIKSNYFLSNGVQINGKLAVYTILPKVTSSSRSAIESLENIMNDTQRYHERTRDYARQIWSRYKDLKHDSKIDKLIEVIKKIFEEDKTQKVLIYTKHPSTLRYISEKLGVLNLRVVEFMGGLNREEKTEIVKQFKENADIMISTETGCEGLNFQFCNNLVNYDLPWNPMSVEQRIGRIDRIGQTRNMNIYSLATQDTMEEYIVDLIINKMCCVGLIIGELPIILFNLGLDGEGKFGSSKIEEMIMNKFIDSKNNLEIFSQGIEEIGKIIQAGIDEYSESKENTAQVLDLE